MNTYTTHTKHEDPRGQPFPGIRGAKSRASAKNILRQLGITMDEIQKLR